MEEFGGAGKASGVPDCGGGWGGWGWWIWWDGFMAGRSAVLRKRLAGGKEAFGAVRADGFEGGC